MSGAPGARRRGVVLASRSLLAGAAWRPERLPQDFADDAEVAAVLVPVTVRDGKGRLVADLDQRKFHLYVDGIEFPIPVVLA